MSARLRFGFTLALLSVVGVAWACGDADGTEALTLKAFHGLKASKDGCSHTENGIVGGLYDVKLASEGGGDFGIYLELVNNLKSNENLGAGRLNSNQVKVTKVEVSFERTGPWGFLPEKLEIPTGIVVDTGETHFTPIGAIPQSVAEAMFDRPDVFPDGIGRVPLRFSAKAFGTLFDGTDATSNDLSFQIDVCRGCLVTCAVAEAVCSSAAQPDGWACAKSSDGGGSAGTGGTGGTGGGSAGSGGDAAGG